MVEGLRGKKIVHVAVGALHCLAVTDTGQVRSLLSCCQDAVSDATSQALLAFAVTELILTCATPFLGTIK